MGACTPCASFGSANVLAYKSIMLIVNRKCKTRSTLFYIVITSYSFSKITKYPVADLRGARGTRAPPGGPNSFNFMQFLGKFGKIVCWRPPGELAPPPWGNPGSATGIFPSNL